MAEKKDHTIYLTLNEEEGDRLMGYLQGEIKRIEKIGGDPFVTAKVVNFHNKVKESIDMARQETTLGNIAGQAIEVVHGAPKMPEAKPAIDPVTIPPTIAPTVVATPEITPENIDNFSSSLIPKDPEDPTIQTPTNPE